MATASLPINLFDNPIAQHIRDQFEREHLGEGGYEGIEGEARRIFNPLARRVWVRTLAADAIDRWGLGETQQEIADELGLDRTRLSDAYRKGDLTLDGFLNFRFHPCCPADWEPVGNSLRMCNRAGFIGVAQFLYERVNPRKLAPPKLDEFHYELMCSLFKRSEEWLLARVHSVFPVAAEILFETLGDQSRDLIPFWFLPADKERIEAAITRLANSKAAAVFHYMRDLYCSWESVFLAAATLCEPFKWSRSCNQD